MRRAFPVVLLLSLLSLGCPATLPGGGAAGGLEGAASGAAGAAGSVSTDINPNGCGGYASSNLGARIKLFLQATVRLENAVIDLQNYLRDTCVMMGRELAMADLQGDTKEVCTAVRTELANSLEVNLKPKATLDVKFQPARCEVNAEASASAGAACSGQAGTGTGASAECAGAGAVSANLEVRCEPAQLEVNAEAGIIVDASKIERAIAAIKAGLPRLLEVHARATGPVAYAVTEWAKAARNLKDAGRSYFADLGAQAVCVTGEIAKAFGAITNIQASLEVSVEVSVEVSGSAGATL